VVNDHVVSCVGAIVHDRGHRLLLIRRAHEPGRGLWSLPGGRVEPGETEHEAVVREIAEETGLTVRVLRLAGRVRRPAPGGRVYDIGDYLCEVAESDAADATDSDTGRTPVAGDDADDVRWVDAAEFARLPVVEGMEVVLREWDALPPTWA
jgi:ADP-ribose pyrophosphatase YjhB (NUDIX family)